MNKSCRETAKFYCRQDIKLEYQGTRNNSSETSEDNTSSNSDDTIIEVVGNPLEDVVNSLPCENPTYDSRGVAVFGRQADNKGKPRSVSTSINRVEFPDTCSTLEKPVRALDNTQAPMMVWDEGSYTGYKLNCHKKKRKVDSLIELYDKDSVNSVQDKEIYKQKLEEISNAALAAVE